MNEINRIIQIAIWIDMKKITLNFNPKILKRMQIHVKVNGVDYSHEVEPRLLLVHYLRDVLRLTGTHIGCETSICGACTIHVNNKATKSCTMLAVQADGCEITTIEGLASNGELASPAGSLQGKSWPSMWFLHTGYYYDCCRFFTKYS